jgi:hypothetical protein
MDAGIRYLQPAEAGINRFAFVIHPLNVKLHPQDTRLPLDQVPARRTGGTTAAYMPPMYISRITGGKSPTTGQRIEGHLFTPGGHAAQMMKHGAASPTTASTRPARMAERKGARIMGLGAFTSVVGDAGITVAHESDIAITSGNSLTVAMTLEAAKQAVMMGART